ncbi:MAG: hypothetical protein O2947_09090, partial [Bacteroidetes bacterium]|nr:hypothetical protein [Bacteroidota bacterium]
MSNLLTTIRLTLCVLLALVVVPIVSGQYPLVVESSPAVGTGGTVYRFYVQMQDPTDRMSAVYGND